MICLDTRQGTRDQVSELAGSTEECEGKKCMFEIIRVCAAEL